MHICVGKFNYFDKMCEGKNYICFVAKANKPYATVEFKKEENNQLSRTSESVWEWECYLGLYRAN